MIHWTWILFVIVILLFIYGIIKTGSNSGDYDFVSGFVGIGLIFGLIAFILIWGGIFWW